MWCQVFFKKIALGMGLIVGLVDIMPSCLRGYFVGLKYFLVGNSWVLIWSGEMAVHGTIQCAFKETSDISPLIFNCCVPHNVH